MAEVSPCVLMLGGFPGALCRDTHMSPVPSIGMLSLSSLLCVWLDYTVFMFQPVRENSMFPQGSARKEFQEFQNIHHSNQKLLHKTLRGFRGHIQKPESHCSPYGLHKSLPRHRTRHRARHRATYRARHRTTYRTTYRTRHRARHKTRYRTTYKARHKTRYRIPYRTTYRTPYRTRHRTGYRLLHARALRGQ